MKKKQKKILIFRFIIFIWLTVFFSIVIFVLKNSLIDEINSSIVDDKYSNHHEDFIEVSVPDNNSAFDIDDYNIGDKQIKEIIENKFYEDQKKLLKFSYFPNQYSEKVEKNKDLITDFLFSPKFLSKLKDINIRFYEDSFGIRGKMKDRGLNFYESEKLSAEEFIGVAVHEYGHFYDIYNLEKKVIRDLSYIFYDISWESTKVIKKGVKQTDFVSGYSISNMYEDFAESITYYILHNDDFLKKTKESELLLKKYNFFSKYIFRGGDFVGTDFSVNNYVKDYYWDITKIKIDEKKLLQYLEK